MAGATLSIGGKISLQNREGDGTWIYSDCVNEKLKKWTNGEKMIETKQQLKPDEIKNKKKK